MSLKLFLTLGGEIEMSGKMIFWIKAVAVMAMVTLSGEGLGSSGPLNVADLTFAISSQLNQVYAVQVLQDWDKDDFSRDWIKARFTVRDVVTGRELWTTNEMVGLKSRVFLCDDGYHYVVVNEWPRIGSNDPVLEFFRQGQKIKTVCAEDLGVDLSETQYSWWLQGVWLACRPDLFWMPEQEKTLSSAVKSTVAAFPFSQNPRFIDGRLEIAATWSVIYAFDYRTGALLSKQSMFPLTTSNETGRDDSGSHILDPEVVSSISSAMDWISQGLAISNGLRALDFIYAIPSQTNQFYALQVVTGWKSKDLLPAAQRLMEGRFSVRNVATDDELWQTNTIMGRRDELFLCDDGKHFVVARRSPPANSKDPVLKFYRKGEEIKSITLKDLGIDWGKNEMFFRDEGVWGTRSLNWDAALTITLSAAAEGAVWGFPKKLNPRFLEDRLEIASVLGVAFVFDYKTGALLSQYPIKHSPHSASGFPVGEGESLLFSKKWGWDSTSDMLSKYAVKSELLVERSSISNAPAESIDKGPK